MKVRVLGSNGWYSTKTANTVCILIETNESYIVLDAGDGIHKLDKYITTDKPIYLFLSHFHLDHTSGFHIFPKFRFPQGITIFGQPSTINFLQTLANRPFMMPLTEMPVKTTVQELREGENILPELPFKVEAQYLVHADPCFGYQFTLEDKIVSYCTDTGYCDNLVRLGKEADLFITECALKAGQEPDEQWPHLSPEIAAKAANEAQAKKLLLNHFSAARYLSNDDKKEADAVAKAIFPNTVVGYDNLEFDI